MIAYYSEYSVFVVGDYVPRGVAEMGVPNHYSHQNYMGRTTWKRYITSQRDVVIPSMSAYADLA